MSRLIPILAALLLVPATAQAADPTNTNDSGPGSLREAIANTATGGTITVPAGTYRLSSELDVTDDVTINGAGANATVVTGQGAVRVFHVTAGAGDTVRFTGLTISQGRVAGQAGNGAGILHDGADLLELDQIALTDNVANPTGTGAIGGGGLYHGNAAASLDIVDSTFARNVATVAGTNSGGAGIFVNGVNATIVNSTISGNQLNVTGSPAGTGGGGYYADDGGGSMNNVTIAQNTAQGGAGGGIFNRSLVDVVLSNTIVANNSSNCSGPIASNGSNLENTDTCNLGAGDLPNTPIPLGPLEDNGGTTPTHRLALGSPAIDAGDDATCELADQRGRDRPQGPECDIGAFEFDGSAQASVPECSPTGAIPVALAAVPGHGVEAVRYKLAGGPEQIIPIPEGGSQAQRTIPFPEGRLSFEYWGDFTNDNDLPAGQLGHRRTNVLVDKTKPSLAITNPNPFRTFVIKRAVKVDVGASDPLSGLTSDPSGLQAINTARRGRRTFAPAAVDLCTNQATAAFPYRVLAPKLGTRTVLERVSGAVRVLPRRSGTAVTSQKKGQRFSALRQPRELPIGTQIDTRRGTARITSSRNTRSAIQNGRFLGGVFQVIQSRKRRAKGLTELRLKGSSFKRCGTSPRGKGASAARRRVIRRLRGNTKGRFRTRGRHSAATVRGTRWIVEDRCDGTLTRVLRGTVAVRDFRRKKTITLRAGKSYLAKARR